MHIEVVEIKCYIQSSGCISFGLFLWFHLAVSDWVREREKERLLTAGLETMKEISCRENYVKCMSILGIFINI